MEKLLKLRNELDQIDEEIIKLYVERMEICRLIGDYKAEIGKDVFDPEREREKLKDVASKVSDESNKEGIQELFKLLMTLSKQIQYQKIL